MSWRVVSRRAGESCGWSCGLCFVVCCFVLLRSIVFGCVMSYGCVVVLCRGMFCVLLCGVGRCLVVLGGVVSCRVLFCPVAVVVWFGISFCCVALYGCSLRCGVPCFVMLSCVACCCLVSPCGLLCSCYVVWCVVACCVLSDFVVVLVCGCVGGRVVVPGGVCVVWRGVAMHCAVLFRVVFWCLVGSMGYVNCCVVVMLDILLRRAVRCFVVWCCVVWQNVAWCCTVFSLCVFVALRVLWCCVVSCCVVLFFVAWRWVMPCCVLRCRVLLCGVVIRRVAVRWGVFLLVRCVVLYGCSLRFSVCRSLALFCVMSRCRVLPSGVLCSWHVGVHGVPGCAALLCCLVSCYVVWCCVLSCGVVWCCLVLWFVVWSRMALSLCCGVVCVVVLCCAVLRCFVCCCVALGRAVLCHVVSCHVTWCCVLLRGGWMRGVVFCVAMWRYMVARRVLVFRVRGVVLCHVSLFLCCLSACWVVGMLVWRVAMSPSFPATPRDVVHLGLFVECVEACTSWTRRVRHCGGSLAVRRLFGRSVSKVSCGTNKQGHGDEVLSVFSAGRFSFFPPHLGFGGAQE